jgi:hypothetical protein
MFSSSDNLVRYVLTLALGLVGVGCSKNPCAISTSFMSDGDSMRVDDRPLEAGLKDIGIPGTGTVCATKGEMRRPRLPDDKVAVVFASPTTALELEALWTTSLEKAGWKARGAKPMAKGLDLAFTQGASEARVPSVRVRVFDGVRNDQDAPIGYVLVQMQGAGGSR